MLKLWDANIGYFHSMWFQRSLEDLWRENGRGGWATLFALILILVWHWCKRFSFRSPASNPTITISGARSRSHPQFRCAALFFFLGFV